MNKKCYQTDRCPCCLRYTLYEVGHTKSGKLILQCGHGNCGATMLEDDISKIRESRKDEKEEKYKEI